MEKNKKMLVELDGKTKKLLIEEILDETGLSCEILCVYMQTHYVAVVNEINNGKKYLAHFGFLMDDREFVQVGKVEELKKQITIYRNSNELHEKRKKFVERMNQLSDSVLLKLVEETEMQEIKQDLCYIMGCVDSAVLYNVIDNEEEMVVNYCLDHGVIESRKRCNFKVALKEDEIIIN